MKLDKIFRSTIKDKKLVICIIKLLEIIKIMNHVSTHLRIIIRAFSAQYESIKIIPINFRVRYFEEFIYGKTDNSFRSSEDHIFRLRNPFVYWNELIICLRIFNCLNKIRLILINRSRELFYRFRIILNRNFKLFYFRNC